MDCSFRQLTTIPNIPVTAFTLDISVNDIVKLPMRAFSKLSKLQSLDLSFNRLRTIEPLAFKGLHSLTEIKLSYNEIDTIPTRVFSEMPQLQSLNVKSNKIQLVEPFAFYGLVSLKNINCFGNKLQILQNKSFANIPRLQYLYLGDNKLQKIARDAFTGTCDISEIDISFNSFSTIPSVGIQPRLRKLDLSDNMVAIGTLPHSYENCNTNLSVDLSANRLISLNEFTFSSLNGTTSIALSLSYNNISTVAPGTFAKLESIQNLDLGYNPLTSSALINIADELSRKQLSNLDLSGVFRTRIALEEGLDVFMNNTLTRLGLCSRFSSIIAYITLEEFSNVIIIRLTKSELYQISDLKLSGNKNLMWIELQNNTFTKLPRYLPASLENLDLRGNNIKAISSDEMCYLSNLKRLQLARNNMKVLSPNAFRGLKNLQVLDLTVNSITVLWSDLFKPLGKLTHLYLNSNDISVLSHEVFDPLLTLRVLDLSDNNYKIVDERSFKSLTSLRVLKLEENNLGKSVFRSDREGLLFRDLIELEEINIAGNHISNLSEYMFRDQKALKILNLGGNKLSGWGSNLLRSMKNLENLDLSYNSIAGLTKTNILDLNNFNELNMAGNPFVCNCDILLFREWIDSTSVALPGKGLYLCHRPEEWRDKPLLEFTKDKINCDKTANNAFVVSVSVSVTIFICIVSGIVLYKNRWRLRLRLYVLSKRGRLFLRNLTAQAQRPSYGAINVDFDQGFYDAYISCSELDNDWVLHHLLPDIDIGRYDDDNIFGGDFKLYFDPRDKDPGKQLIEKQSA